MTLPNFVIAGTSRSGTTSLYYYLQQHPDIGFPSKKEPKYFSSLGLSFPHNGPGDQIVDKLMVRDYDKYVRLFDGLGEKVRIGEASSDYLYHHGHSAHEMRRVLGDVQIILCLRNPVERAYSAYLNLVRDQRETLQFADALASEDQRVAANWDWMWAYKRGGLYAEQVETFMRTFSRVKVVLFDDLKNDPQSVVRELFDFLGVAQNVAVDTSTHYSKSGKAKNRLVAFLSNRDNAIIFSFRQMLLKSVPRSMLEFIASRTFVRTDMDANIRDEMRLYYRDNIKQLEELLGRSLDAWK